MPHFVADTHVTANPDDKKSILKRAGYVADIVKDILQKANAEINRMLPNILDTELIAPDENANIEVLRSILEQANAGPSAIIPNVNTVDVIHRKMEKLREWYHKQHAIVKSAFDTAKEKIGQIIKNLSTFLEGIRTYGEAYDRYLLQYSAMKSTLFHVLGKVLDEFLNGGLLWLGAALPPTIVMDSETIPDDDDLFKSVRELYLNSEEVIRADLVLHAAIVLTTNHLSTQISGLKTNAMDEGLHTAMKSALLSKVENAKREALTAAQTAKANLGRLLHRLEYVNDVFKYMRARYTQYGLDHQMIKRIFLARIIAIRVSVYFFFVISFFL